MVAWKHLQGTRGRGGTRRPGRWSAVTLALLLLGACGDETPTGVPEAPLLSHTPASTPAQVSDLSVVGTTENSVTLSWTEVDDGAGGPADYTVRYHLSPIGYGWGQATVVVSGECASPVRGSRVGSRITCTVGGLKEGLSFDFRIVSYRGEGGGRVFGPLSNVATGTTVAKEQEESSAAGKPGRVGDLSVVETGSSSVTISWTQVDDGAGSPADYTVRHHLAPIGHGWGEATIVTSGECASPIEGTGIGETVTCTVTGLEEGTSYDLRLVSYRQGSDGRVFGDLSNVATAVTGAETGASSPGKPGRVADLSVVEYGTNSATLTWTEVDDGAGGPADYTVRYHLTPIGYGWGDATIVTSGDCGSPVKGTRAGAKVTCTVNGLGEGTSYDFRLVSYRQDPDGPVFGDLSNVVTGTTEGSSSTYDDGPDYDDAPDAGDGGANGGSSSARYGNEPSGFRSLSERGFDSTNESGWSSQSGNSNFSIVSDRTAPASSPNAGRVRYPAGSSGGRSPFWTYVGIKNQGYSELYVSFWVKVSDNWQGHGSRVNKIGFVWTNGKPVVVPLMRGSGSEALSAVITLQDVPDGARRLDPNVGQGRIERGRWHQWEIVLVHNTGDNANGQAHWWVDGRKVGEYRNLRFSRSGQGKIWESVYWRPIWGGVGDEVKQTMYMWMDHAYVSGAR